MTEKEKMLSGLLYNAALGDELTEERLACKELCYEFNHLRPRQTEEREALLRKLFGQMGKNGYIEPLFYCDYGYNIKIGDNFFANHNCVILDAAPVTIGSDVQLAPGCGIYTSGHPLDSGRRIALLEFALPITIENKAWLGGNVVVLPGVTIGEGSVIAAGSVVTKDIPPGVLAAGSPCRVLREITEADARQYQ